MWFAKWFGRTRDDEDSEPSEHPPHPNAMRTPHATTGNERLVHSQNAAPPKANTRKGFDPYNSGSFDRHKAWSRIIR